MEDGEVYAEDALLGYVLSIVNGRTVGKGNYEDFQKYYKINELTDKSITGKKKREEFDYFIEAIKWVAMCMKEVFRPHPKHRPMIWGPLTSHKKFRGMTKTQYTQSIVELINISNRMDREEISKPIILLVYRFVKPREFVEFLSLLEKIIFRNFCVDKTRIDKGSIDFGKFCKTFFDSVKGKEPSNPADAKQITKAFNKLKENSATGLLIRKSMAFQTGNCIRRSYKKKMRSQRIGRVISCTTGKCTVQAHTNP